MVAFTIAMSSYTAVDHLMCGYVAIGYCSNPRFYVVLEPRGMLHNHRGRSWNIICYFKYERNMHLANSYTLVQKTKSARNNYYKNPKLLWSLKLIIPYPVRDTLASCRIPFRDFAFPFQSSR